MKLTENLREYLSYKNSFNCILFSFVYYKRQGKRRDKEKGEECPREKRRSCTRRKVVQGEEVFERYLRRVVLIRELKLLNILKRIMKCGCE